MKNTNKCDCSLKLKGESPWLVIGDLRDCKNGCVRQWSGFSNHNFRTPSQDDLHKIQAFYLVQEANQNGEYYRVIYWINGKTYITTEDSISDDHSETTSKFMFRVSLKSMTMDCIYVDFRTGLNYKVIYSNEFRKVLIPTV